MRQFRAEPRIPCNLPVELSWEIGAGYMRKLKATLKDTSKNGMGLLVPTPLTIGAKVEIFANTKTHAAIVKRCMKSGTDHWVGVRLQH
jgi:hypothetical protein